jgi:predicted RNA-binding Zn-ribbon protein involved in translation (DUF1610 family)
MKINKNCKICNGLGKVTNKHGTFKCPDCNWRDKFRIAEQMKEGYSYKIPADRMDEMQELANLFHEPTLLHTWHIELLSGDMIRRVDYCWMQEN